MKEKMTNNYLIKCFGLIFICYVLDSTLNYFLPYDFTKDAIMIVPCIGLMMFSMLVKTVHGNERYIFTAGCSIYYMLVYGNSLAIYILIYYFIAFIRTYIFKIESLTLPETMTFCTFVVLAQEVVVYWLMKITNITAYPVITFLLMRILPTLLFNLVLSVGVYYIYHRVKTKIDA